jgi:hypothetical protein
MSRATGEELLAGAGLALDQAGESRAACRRSARATCRVMSGMSLRSSNTINVTGNVVMYFTCSVSMNSGNGINLAAGATLTVFLTAGTFSINSDNNVDDKNDAPKPADFSFWSTSAGAVSMHSGGAMHGRICAANSSGISANSGSGWYGAMVTGGSLSLNSGRAFHYDEALSSTVALPNSSSASTVTIQGSTMW